MTHAVALGLCLLLVIPGPVGAGSRPLVDGGASSINAVPIDASKITFRAFRSFDMPIVPGQPFYLQVDRRTPAGPMHFAEFVDGSEAFLGNADWQLGGTVNGVQIYLATWLIDPAVEGTHTYRAVFEPTDQYEALTLQLEVVVETAAFSMSIYANENPVQTHHLVMLWANFSGGDTGAPISGTFEWRNADSGAVIATRTWDDYNLSYSSLPVGLHRFTLSYLGDSTRAPSTSPVFELEVTPDIAEASNVGAQYRFFHPFTDGYRDTVAFKGTRAETISVAIDIYDAGGGRVGGYSVPAGTGAYARAWNGRNAKGTILPEGTYHAIQTLTDAFGSKSTFTSSVRLSHGKLVTYTKDVVLPGSSLSASGQSGTASVTVSNADHSAKLTAGTGQALAGWEFLVPTGTVLKSVTVSVYASAVQSAPPTWLGTQNFGLCAHDDDWNQSCFANWTGVGNAGGTAAWYSAAGSISAPVPRRSEAFVRGLVVVSFSTVYVYEARARVVYQVLDTGEEFRTIRRS